MVEHVQETVDAPLVPPDSNTAQRKAANPAASVWVAASAGSGKTKVLTDRILNLLLDGNDPHRLLCLTFTKAAAAEMSVRLSRKLADWAVIGEDPAKDKPGLRAEIEALRGRQATQQEIRDARRLFAKVLDAPGGLIISTIHAFCQSLLGRFPIEAGISPHFSALDERTAVELMDAARKRVLERARVGRDPELADALAVMTEVTSDTGFEGIIDVALRDRAKLSSALDHAGGEQALIDALCRKVGVGIDETEHAVRMAASEETAFDGTALRAAVLALETGTKTDQNKSASMAAWLSESDVERRADLWDAWRLCFLTAQGDKRAKQGMKPIVEKHPDSIAAMDAEAERILGVEARCRAVALARRTVALIRLAGAVLEDYQSGKDVRAQLDFDDLILKTGDLLQRRGVSDWVMYKLDGGIDHILIDEAQDTAPRQWSVVRALADEFFTGDSAHEAIRPDVARTVFVVGDVKQSIYSFQGADPQGFLINRAEVAQKAADVGRTLDTVPLDTSFRSSDAVLRAVDTVFNRDPARVGVAERDPRPQDRRDGEFQAIRHEAFRVGQAGRVEVWPLIGPRQDEAETAHVWSPPVQRSRADDPLVRLAQTIADRVRRWIGSERLPARERPIRAGDIMILVRKRDRLVGELVRALKQNQVPVAGVDRMVLSNHMAVRDLINLGRALLLPADDLMLATVLKSPFFGATEDELFDLSWDRPHPRLWQSLKTKAETDPVWATHLKRFEDFQRRADRMTPHDLFQSVLADGGRRALIARLRSDADEAIDEFLDQALAFEASHPPTLQGFLHWLGGSDVEAKRELDGDTVDQVRIMTVHGSKGLQAPIVILPDTARTPQPVESLLWSLEPDGDLSVPLWSSGAQRDEALAAKARNAWKARQEEEYRRLLYVAMTRAEDRLVICGWHGPKGPSEHSWYDLVRGAVAEIAEARSDDAFEADETVLVYETEQRAPPKDQPREHSVVSGEAPAVDWLFRPAPRDPTPPQPLAPTRSDEDEVLPVRSPLSDGGRFVRGTILHTLLQTLPDVAEADREDAGRRFLSRPVHGLEEDQIETWLSEALAVLNDPRFAPVFASGSRAEAPVVGVLGGRVVSRRIDRLYIGSDTVFIVDYKTNRPSPNHIDAVPETYIRQLADYRMLMADLYPNHAIRCALLWTEGPHLMEIPEALTDHLLGVP